MASKFATADKARIATSLQLLRDLGGQAMTEDKITFSGHRITLPEGTSIPDNIRILQQVHAEQQQMTTFKETFLYRPWDGAYTGYKAMKEAFGMISHHGTFFQAPELVTIPVDVDETERVPWGLFSIPFLPGVEFSFGSVMHEEFGEVFQVAASGPQMLASEVNGVFKLIGEALKTDSLYRGKALDGRDQPNFIDVFSVDPRTVVYSEEVLRQLSANVWSYIKYADAYAAAGIPTKRSVVLYGPYGTGKTLAGLLTGQVARRHGYTFLMARPGRDDFMKVLQTARLYQPAVVYFEDVDTIANPQGLDGDGLSMLLDAFDGITSKNTRIIGVFTTNHPERVHAGMWRPGRIDKAIKIGYLDTVGVEKLIRATVPETMIAGDVDFQAISDSMPEFTPSFITGVAKGAFDYALDAAEGHTEGILLTTQDFLDSARSYRDQLELQQGAPVDAQHDSLSDSLHRVVVSAAKQAAKSAIYDEVHPDVLI